MLYLYKYFRFLLQKWPRKYFFRLRRANFFPFSNRILFALDSVSPIGIRTHTGAENIIYIYLNASTSAVWAVRHGSGRAVLNELAASNLGRQSTPSRLQLPDRPQPRRPLTSTHAPRHPVLGRHGGGAAVTERGGARCRARICAEAVPPPRDRWRPIAYAARVRARESMRVRPEHAREVCSLSCSLCSTCCLQVRCQVLGQLH